MSFKSIVYTFITVLAVSGAVSASELKLKAQIVDPEPPKLPLTLNAQSLPQANQGGAMPQSFASQNTPKAPQCAIGFVAQNIQLATTSGNAKTNYYVYECERVEKIQYMCNADTSATNIEIEQNNILPIEGGKMQTDVKFSYACYKPVG